MGVYDSTGNPTNNPGGRIPMAPKGSASVGKPKKRVRKKKATAKKGK